MNSSYINSTAEVLNMVVSKHRHEVVNFVPSSKDDALILHRSILIILDKLKP